MTHVLMDITASVVVGETSVRSLAPESGIRHADPLGGWSKRLLGERNLLPGTRPVGPGALRTECSLSVRGPRGGRPRRRNWRAGRPPPEGRPRYCGAPLRHHPHTGPLRVGSGASSARRIGKYRRYRFGWADVTGIAHGRGRGAPRTEGCPAGGGRARLVLVACPCGERLDGGGDAARCAGSGSGRRRAGRRAARPAPRGRGRWRAGPAANWRAHWTGTAESRSPCKSRKGGASGRAWASGEVSGRASSRGP